MPGEIFKHKVKGFSFVEMSVVLASIAAVVVMTTAGVSLMKRGKLQNILSDISSFSNSISEFEQTYDALPGDISNVSSLSGANAGNGDGTINSTGEALDLWQHLSIAGLIEGSFDGNSTNLPGIGVPTADIEGGGYKITPAASTGFNTDADATNDLPEQALIIELAGFSSSSNSLPILTSEDAKTIDERADDGNPLTGTILAEGLNNDCVTAGGEYNLSEKTASCRVLFLIKSGKASKVSPEVSGSCAELGQTRQVSDVNQTCPTGYVGKIIETCRIGSDNQGVWEITDRLCTEVKCGKDGMFGDIRKLACINKMKGTEGVVEQCTENGVWKVLRSDCNIVTSTPCPTNGDVRPHAQACDWGEQGYMIQTCTNNKWGPPAPDTCSAILCDSDNIGDVQDSASTCGSDYNGTVKEVCTSAGTWEKTSIGSTCAPDYSGSCTFGVSADKDIGCPPGKTGTHILTCINADTDYWTTLTDTCRPIKCDGDRNIGNVRVKEGAFCPENKNGTVMEYCDETGAWAPITNNCVTGVCEQPNDTEGNAYWPTTEGGAAASPTACVEGYEEQATAPTRVCNSDGTWGTVSFQCVRKQCPTTFNNATYPATFVGDNNVIGTCDAASGYTAQAPGYPLADCGTDKIWENERVPCLLTCPKYDETDIGFTGIDLWYDAADGCKVFSDSGCSIAAVAGSSNVGCVLDKSGNGFNLTQSVATYKPSYTSTAAGQNSLPTISFDGVDNFLQYPDIGSFVETTGLFVHKEDSYTANGHYLMGSASWVDKDVFVYYASTTIGGLKFWVEGRSPDDIIKSSYSSAGTYNITSVYDDNEISIIYKNGISQTSSVITTPINKDWGPGNVGSWGYDNTYFLDGNIGEIMVYDTALSATNRQVAEAYLGDKWNIPVSTLFDTAILWLDADDASTVYQTSACSGSLATAGTHTVGCWVDKSGRNNHALQTSSSKEPLYQANAMNSKPVLLFDRSSQEHLVIPNSSGNDFDLTDSFTIITVLKFDEIGDYWGTFLNRGDSDKPEPFEIGTYKEKSSSKWRFYFDVGDGGKSPASTESTSGSITTGSDYIASFRSSGGDYHQVYLNGSLDATGTDSTSLSGSTHDLFIGSFDSATSEGLEGEMAEMLIFPAALITSEREMVEIYLGDKWGIATPDIQPLSCDDSSVLPVTSSNILWLDANDCSTVYKNAACSTLVDSSGDNVGCWTDKSGSGNDAIQATSAKQPAFRGSRMNGKPIIDFVGSNKTHLAIPDSSGNDFDMSGNWTIFYVLKFDEIGDYWGSFLTRGASGAKPFEIGSYKEKKSGDWRLYYDVGNGSSVTYIESSNGSINTSADRVITFRTNAAGNDHRIYLNGVLNVTSTSAATITGTTDDVFIGAFDNDTTEALDGEIAEIIIYDSALSNTAGGDRESVEDYLGSKWGITITH